MNKSIELSPRVWEMAFDHWPDKKLIQCGNGIHHDNEYCVNCFYNSRQMESKQ